MKRLLSVFLVCSIILSVSAVSSLAATAEKDENAIDINGYLNEAELREAYMNDEQFQAHYETDPEGALNLLDKIVQDYFEVSNNKGISILGFDDESAYLLVTTYKQPNSYYCGPASSLIAISGWNGTGNVSGSTDAAKMDTLAGEMGTNSTDGTAVYRVRQGLNNYVPNGQYKYSYYLGSTLTDLTFRSYLYNSLAYGRVPLLHAKTGALSYYNGHNTGHYIAVSKIDHSTMQVRLNDPNNNSSYYGTHYVSLSEALSCIHDYSSRYLICYWP